MTCARCRITKTADGVRYRVPCDPCYGRMVRDARDKTTQKTMEKQQIPQLVTRLEEVPDHELTRLAMNHVIDGFCERTGTTPTAISAAMGIDQPTMSLLRSGKRNWNEQLRRMLGKALERMGKRCETGE